jgi:hypothetical protein
LSELALIGLKDFGIFNPIIPKITQIPVKTKWKNKNPGIQDAR